MATSNLGCCLCVWNVNAGQLLRKYNDADEDRRAFLLPQGSDVTSMCYVKQLNAYICVDGFLHVWSFPTSEGQKDDASSIKQREQDLRRNAGER